MIPDLIWQNWTPLWAFSPILAAMIWTDFSQMRIPNVFSLIGLAIFAAGFLVLPIDQAMYRALVGAICFAICLALYALNWIGGGDAKVLPVVFLMIPTAVISQYMLLLSAAMALGLVGMSVARSLSRNGSSNHVSMRQRGEFPMGISIGFSGLVLAVVGLMQTLL